MPPEAIFLLEREVKLLFPSAESARAAVLATGALVARPRRLQDDSLYDMADELFRKKACVVRIRTEWWSNDTATTALTVKGPVQPGQMKVREEHETRVENGDALRHAFAMLGLHP